MVMLQLLEKGNYNGGTTVAPSIPIRGGAYEQPFLYNHISTLFLCYDGQNAELKIYRGRRTSISPLIFIKSSDVSMG